MLADIYINSNNAVNRSTAVMGLLYNRGIIKDRASIEESNNTRALHKKFMSDNRKERKKILERFERGELTE